MSSSDAILDELFSSIQSRKHKQSSESSEKEFKCQKNLDNDKRQIELTNCQNYDRQRNHDSRIFDSSISNSHKTSIEHISMTSRRHSDTKSHKSQSSTNTHRQYQKERSFSSRRSRNHDSSRKDSRNERHYTIKSNERDKERPPIRQKEDIFWESKWDAMELQKKADAREKRGKHFLEAKKPIKTVEVLQKKKDKKKSISKRERSESPETEELKRLKKLKEIQDLVVKDSEKYVVEPLDPNLFEWDNMSKMWRKKTDPKLKSYTSEIKKSINEHFKTDNTNQDTKEKEKKILDSSEMTLDEIEELKKTKKDETKKDETKKQKEDSAKEDGEIIEENEKNNKSERERRHKSLHKSIRNSRHRSRRSSSQSRRRSGSRSRRRSGSQSRRRSSSQSRRRSSSQSRRRSGSRRRSRSRRSRRSNSYFRSSRSAIDKEKLLAIAKKNAVKLLSSDNLMGMDHERLLAIKSGGQSLVQLTQFCRELALKGISNEFSDTEEEFHHPFMINERPLPHPMMLSSTGVQSETLTPAMKLAAKSHRMLEFPVSSGNAHRVKEKENVIEASSSPKVEEENSVISVFEDTEESNKDIGSIVSQRLSALRKLTDNPNDSEALQEMYTVQKEMSSWASSKNKPGLFNGHTGAKVLSKGELSLGIQAWARQEQFTTAQKVSGGFGEFMLRKMGWNEGEGLGKDRSGDIDPLTLDIKNDKKGFMAAEEGLRRKKNGVLTLTGCKDLSGKHPVSGLIELATRRKWGPPLFSQVFECGPPNCKQYIFKVTVNGMDFQPTIASENKKKAKADAATFALVEMGLLPKDPNNPL